MFKPMKKWMLLLLLVPLAAHAEIYRSVDSAGNVVYSDQPRPGSKPVKLPGISTYKPSAATRAAEKAKAPAPPGATSSHQVTITNPADQATIRDNAGNVPVQVQVQPPLDAAAGQRLSVSVDGSSDVYTATSNSFQLQNINRGTHTVTVWVVGPNDEPLGPKATTTFFMHHTTLKQSQKAAQATGHTPEPTPPPTSGGSQNYQPRPSSSPYRPPAGFTPH